ncbi:MAG: GNAT family N-acetyltransferase [Clostridia bacterium]|nr:GNAT family N-acetyltransferase [Clostridia bacterium]
MVIETKRLTIHTASREEMMDFIEKQTDGILIKAYREMLMGCLEHPQEWDWYAIWFIELKDGSHVGDLSFKGFRPDGSVEIGYGISEENRGNGYAAEAVGAVTAWALKQPGVCRVEAETEPLNRASQRVLEKCGFVPSGITGEEGPRFFKTRR